jgi:hypothetical protein
MSDMEHIMDESDPEIIAKAKSLLRGLDGFRTHLSHLAASAEGLSENIGRLREHPAFEPLAELGDSLASIGASAAGQAAEFDRHAAALAALGVTLGTLAIGAGIIGLLGGGVISVGLAALAVGVGALAAVNWEWVTEKMKAFDDAVVDFQKLAFDKVAAGIKAIGDGIASLWEKIKSILPNIGGWKDIKGNFNQDFGAGALPGGGKIGPNPGRGMDPQIADIIRKSAIAHGVDPNTALQIAMNEGARGYRLNAHDRGGDGGKSGGVYQLYTGGGEGNRYHALTGRSPFGSSLADVQAQVDYTLKRVHETGWTPWHGARDHGIGKWQGIGRQGGVHVHVHTNPVVNIDGKQVSKAVAHHFVKGAAHATSVAAAPDGHSQFQGPGSEVWG